MAENKNNGWGGVCIGDECTGAEILMRALYILYALQIEEEKSGISH